MPDLLTANIKKSKSYTVNVWDISIRLFHWSLVAGMAFLWFSGEDGGNIMTWHMYIGYSMLGLIVYRLIWGFIGTPYARFSDFLTTPLATIAYLKRFMKGAKTDHIGHNPLGGWMAILLMALTLIQATTGLFSSDDIFNEGPFYAWVSSQTGEFLTSIHHLNFNFILAAVALHITAVAYHGIIKKEPLVKSMLTGKKLKPRPVKENIAPNYMLMFFSASISAAGVYLLIYLT